MVKKSDPAQNNGKRNQPRRPASSTAELNDLKVWLDTLELDGIKPTIHVNGHQFTTAIVTIDFGQPLKQNRLTSEQSSELSQRLRRAGREVLGKEANIRVSSDNANGIHWASVA